MTRCPKCGSHDIHLSHTKNVVERAIKAMWSKRPHRCRACRWRGWGAESGPKYSIRIAKAAEHAVQHDREHRAPTDAQAASHTPEAEALPPLDLGSLDQFGKTLGEDDQLPIPSTSTRSRHRRSTTKRRPFWK